MKKLHTSLATLALLILILAPTAQVHAQNPSVGDQTIQDSLRERGVDQAPGPIEVQQPEVVGNPTSGFADEDGNPISQEEFAQIKAEDEKGIFEKQPWLAVLIVLAITAAVALLFKNKQKRA